MTRRSQPVWRPSRSGGPVPVRRGPRRSYDPFYVFEDQARPGKSAPVPKRELQLMSLLGSKVALVVMSCLAIAVVATLVVLLATRA